ncbi:MAG: DegV family protein [Kosmotogaceae bacterium]|nr:DegV family protein [Kosmotogaceae bacterium]
MIGVIVDSGCDLPDEVKSKDNVRVVLLKIILDGKEYRDNIDISTSDLLEYMENKFPKTSLPRQPEIGEAFESLYEKGFNEILFIGISSGLSGTLDQVKSYVRDFSETHGDLKIEVVDSKNISIGSGLLAMKAVDLIDSGQSFEGVVKNILSSVSKAKVFFCIPVLKYLKAGGRIGKVTATIGDVLDLKPVITVGEDGVYHSVSKERGMKRAVKSSVKKLVHFIDGNKVLNIAAYTSDKSEKTMEFFRMAVSEIKSAGISQIVTGQISQSLVCHTGPGLIGVAAILE